MVSISDLQGLCARFRGVGHPTRIRYVGNPGGFTGARLWQIESETGLWCLRAWPPRGMDESRLEFIHTVLRAAAGQGLEFIPVPLQLDSGKTYVELEGRLWEMSRWMPGSADFHARPSDRRLAAAMQALARFHRATQSIHSTVAVSPTLERRREHLRRMCCGPEAERLAEAVPDGRWPEMDTRAVRLLHIVRLHRVQLDRMLSKPLPPVACQPAIRDIWHNHVLFVGDEVGGIVDFGSLAIDTIAIDVARLLGSLAGGDLHAWRVGLEAYAEVRELTPTERHLIALADYTGTIGGGLVWLMGHYVQKHKFDNPRGVLERVDHFLARLESPEMVESAVSAAHALEAITRSNGDED